MSVFSIQIANLPVGVTANRLEALLSSQGKVLSLKMASGSCRVQMESSVLLSRIKKSPTGTMGLVSFLSMDSSGLGELGGATVRLGG